MRRPENNEYGEWYAGYVSSITETDVVAVLAAQKEEIAELFGSIDESMGTYAYAEGKWTIKELLGHIIDAERVFGYRLHRFSHGDPTPLSSFDQDVYVANSRSNARAFADMIDEFTTQRGSNLALARSFREEDWDLTGIASDNPVTVRALTFIMAGHVRHHSHILRERYLK